MIVQSPLKATCWALITLLFVTLNVVFASAQAASQPSPRERLLLDWNWRFKLGEPDDGDKSQFEYPEFLNLKKHRPDDEAQEAKNAALRVDAAAINLGRNVSWVQPGFEDAAWRRLDLPHDWIVELPFDAAKRGDKDHGYKPAGPQIGNTIGWYRRTFDLPASDQGRALWIEFDGVYRNSLVWLNGVCLGRHISGYTSFHYDISRHARYGGKNTLVVRADASRDEGWFYEGAGIYRHVWLVKTGAAHVAHWGTFVTSRVQGANAAVTAQMTLRNDGTQPTSARLISTVLNAEHQPVARVESAPLCLLPGQEQTLRPQLAVRSVRLWSLETPNLYTLVSQVVQGGKVLDRYETPFGIRTIRFDANQGFFLNGRHVYIKGTCNHQDHAGVGTAIPDRLNVWRLERLKEMGCNAYRASHNPPTPELLAACDRLGILVLDEHRRLGNTPEIMGQLDSLVRRDRNHPSIFLWAIGNEELSAQGNDNFTQTVAAPMQNLVHRLDPTRPVTFAMNWDWGKGFSHIIDVQGFNYRWNGYQGRKRADRGDKGFMDADQFHAAFPNKSAIGTEEASTVSTRGAYETDRAKNQLSAYDVNLPRWGEADREWGSTAEGWWNYYLARPWIAGAFVWTGFDYRGEPTPFGWPSINSYFGIMDTCGFPKDNYYFYQSWWSNKPVLHVFPHWNWAGREGQEIDVRVHSNFDAVELLLDGQSLGKKAMPRNSHLQWKVPYTPGTLEARGYRGDRVAATEKVQTTGEPARIVLMPDRVNIRADGEDVVVYTVSAVDNTGRVVPTANNLVQFEIEGSGKIIGVGNGNPTSLESDKAPQRSLFNGLAQVIVQATKQAGAIRLRAKSAGLPSTANMIQARRATLRPAVP